MSSKSEATNSQRMSKELLLDEETEEVTTVKDKEQSLLAVPPS